MPETPKPLVHSEAETKEDEVLAHEARAYLMASPAAQVMAELLGKLRSMNLSWWTAEKLRTVAPATDRMRWLAQRPDLRQRITSSLTGLAPKAARKKTADFQAGLIDSVIDDGDTTLRTFEESFAPTELAAYGPVREFWRQFRKQFPLDQKTSAHQEIMTWLLNALLAETSEIDAMTRAPILTPWDVRTSLDGRVWHTHMPIDIRIAIDDARFAQERSDPKRPFHAADDMAIALPQVITAHVALKDLAGILDRAEQALGLAEALVVDARASAPDLATPAPADEKAAPNGASVAESTSEEAKIVPPDSASEAKPARSDHQPAPRVSERVAPLGSPSRPAPAALVATSSGASTASVPNNKQKGDVPVPAKGNPHPTSGVMTTADVAKGAKKGSGGFMLGAALGLADENDELQAFIDMDGMDEEETEERTSPRIEVPPQARMGGGRR